MWDNCVSVQESWRAGTTADSLRPACSGTCEGPGDKQQQLTEQLSSNMRDAYAISDMYEGHGGRETTPALLRLQASRSLTSSSVKVIAAPFLAAIHTLADLREPRKARRS